jgi:hypothetical protein
MEKAAAFPLQAVFMPNSPMPMLEVSDWLLLTTLSTIDGGSMASSFLVSGVSLLAAGFLLLPCLLLCSLPGFIIIFLVLLMVVGVEQCTCFIVCCVVCCEFLPAGVLNQYSLVCVVYNCTHLKTGVRQPSLIQKQNKDDGQTQN